ncbi:energy transducer TonB [Acetobacter sacchari]|uniref:Energy transducer TonB n=1 Tax=Acetobacter sacchari TaxID=2661687 RepID=A0ABS3LRK9_9PROT|nr:energy transducer TonB [Acetobacter sacchari]MBO1358533.1 energy transducer TonB [Acetobacter sacchari]
MVRPRRSETVLMRRSAVMSGLLHLAILLAAVLSLPTPKPPEPEEPPPVEMQFEGASGGGAPARAAKPAPQPAPAPAPIPSPEPPTPTPPKPQPTEETPPPPPPPPPVPPPPQQETPPLPDTPLPPKAEEPTPDAVKTPPSPPAPPQPTHAVAPPSPQTQPTDALPDTAIPSHITQPNKAKKAEADTHSLLETLDSFRSDTKQTHAPKAKPNPAQGGAPNGGGTPDGDITGAMSAGDQRAIGGEVRRCYAEDTAAKDYASFVAHLIVTVDATGEARLVAFAPETQAKMNADPSYRALAERARAAVLSPTCSKLPIPKNLLGQTRQLKFVFRP